MKYGLEIRPAAALDFVSLGALVHRLDPGHRSRSARRPQCQIHVSGGEFNCAANLADCFGLQDRHRDRDGRLSDRRPDRRARAGDGRDAVLQALQARRRARPEHGDGLQRPRPRRARAGRVLQPRNEAAALLKPGDFDWKAIFAGGVRWFHSGGIFAALSETTAELIIEGMKAAKAAGAVDSFDLNYRAKLWNIWGGARARAVEVIARIVENVDVLVGNEEDLQKGLGIPGPEVAAKSQARPERLLRHDRQGGRRSTRSVKVVATTLREVHSTNRHSWGAVAWIDGKTYVSPDLRARRARPRRRRRRLRRRLLLRPAQRASRRARRSSSAGRTARC